MSGAGMRELPPMRVIAPALRTTTELLAAELGAAGATAPEWSEFEWTVARAVAAMQGISTLLANRLRWQGPPEWREFLQRQRQHSVRRDGQIAELLARLDARLAAAGIGAVALKGASLRKLGVYAPGERPMSDIDLLIAPADKHAVEAAVLALGYHHAHASRRHTCYEPAARREVREFGEHESCPIKVEVHEHVAEPLPASSVDITAALAPLRPEPGLNFYRSGQALFLHLLLHAAGNMRSHTLRLVQLHDLSVLAPRFGTAAWEEMSAGGAQAWWWYPPLALCARYFRGAVPAELLRKARHACPSQLRYFADRWRLSTVSWSNPRTSALPGVQWARSLLEVLRFARSRALPDAATRAALEYAMASMPQLAGIPWYGLSQRRRILAWLTARAPRVQTLSSIRAALVSSTP